MSETFEERLERIKLKSLDEKTGTYSPYLLYTFGDPSDLRFLIECTHNYLHPYQNPWDNKFLTDPESKRLIREFRWQKMKPFIYFLLGVTLAFATMFMSGCAEKNIQTLRFDGQDFRCEIAASEWQEIHRGRMTLAVKGRDCVVFYN